MKKTAKTDAHALAVGKFYRTCGEYSGRFERGGDKKLQAIIGDDLYYQKGKSWWFNNSKIIGMTTSELKKITSKLEKS